MFGVRHRPSRPVWTRFRPRVEELEDRLAPAVHTWTGGGDGVNFSDSNNWSGGTPNGNDELVFPSNLPGGGLRTLNNNLTAGLDFRITFSNNGGNTTYLLQGNAIDLNWTGGGSGTPFITNNSGLRNTVSFSSIRLLEDATFSSNLYPGALIITSTVDLNDFVLTMNGASHMRISGTIYSDQANDGSGTSQRTGRLVKSGNGTVYLRANNSATLNPTSGDVLTVNSGGIVVAEANGAFGGRLSSSTPGSVVVNSGGSVAIQTGVQYTDKNVIVNINGNGVNVPGYGNLGAIFGGHTSRFEAEIEVDSDSSIGAQYGTFYLTGTNVPLIDNDNSVTFIGPGNFIIEGLIRDFDSSNGQIIKNNLGTIDVYNTQNYFQDTIINVGVMRWYASQITQDNNGNTTGPANFVINGGELIVYGSINSPSAAQNGQVTVNNGGLLTVASGGVTGSIIVNSGGLAIIEQGGTVARGSADVTVNAGGEVFIDGTVNDSLTVAGIATVGSTGLVSGTATVNNGGLLAGTGTIAGLVTVQSGGTVSPGDNAGFDVGTLTVGSAVFQAGSTLRIQVVPGSPPTSDRLAVTGNLNLSAANDTIDFDLSALSPGSDSFNVTMATYGTLSGTFNNVTRTPASLPLPTVSYATPGSIIATISGVTAASLLSQPSTLSLDPGLVDALFSQDQPL